MFCNGANKVLTGMTEPYGRVWPPENEDRLTSGMTLPFFLNSLYMSQS